MELGSHGQHSLFEINIRAFAGAEARQNRL